MLHWEKRDFKAFQIHFFSFSVRYVDVSLVQAFLLKRNRKLLATDLAIALCRLVQNHYIPTFVHFLGQLSRELSSVLKKADKFSFRDKVRQDNKTD